MLDGDDYSDESDTDSSDGSGSSDSDDSGSSDSDGSECPGGPEESEEDTLENWM